MEDKAARRRRIHQRRFTTSLELLEARRMLCGTELADYPNSPGGELCQIQDVLTGQLSPAGDIDWFRLEAQKDSVYRLTIGDDQDTNSQLSLYAADGTTLLAATDADSNQHLAYRFEEDGSYLLSVQHEQAAVDQYHVFLNESPVALFEVEPQPGDDQLALGVPNSELPTQFTVVADTTSQTQELSFRSVAGAHEYVVEFRPVDYTGRASIRWQGDSNTFRVEADGVPTRQPKLTIPADTDGVQTVRIATTGSGTYQVLLHATTDDWADTREEATAPTQLPTVISTTLHDSRDVDVIAFTPEPGMFYHFDIRAAASPAHRVANINYSITGPSGNRLPHSELDYWLFEQPGTYYLTVDGRLFSQFWASVTAVPDDHANVISPAANQLTFGEAQPFQFEHPSDRDTFAFDALQGQGYQLLLSPPDPGLALRILSADGESKGQRALWTAPDSGTYYAQAYRYLSASEPPAEQYTITLGTVEDDHPDLFTDSIPLLELGTPLTALAETWGDRDLFAFSAQADQGYELRRTQVLAFYSVWSPSGEELPAEYVDGSLRVRTPETGVYHIAIDNRQIGKESPFQLDAIPDDFGSSPGPEAVVLTKGEAVTGQLETPGDRDVFALQVEAEQWANVSLSSDSAQLTIVDADGLPLTSENSWRFTDAGTYYVDVHGAVGAEYQLTLTTLTSDLEPDTPNQTLVPLESGAIVEGEISTKLDRDTFAVDLTAHDELLVHLLDSDGSVLFEVLDEAGSVIVDASNQISLAAAEQRRVYVRVVAHERSSYRFTLFSRPDQPGSFTDIQQSPMLEFDVLNGGIGTQHEDVDFFRLTATAGDHVYFKFGTHTRIVTYKPSDLQNSPSEITGAEYNRHAGWTVEESGEHIVAVRSGPPFSTNVPYTITAYRDDIPNVIGVDTPLLRNDEAISGRTEGPGDRDIIAFEASPTEQISLQFATDHPSLLKLELHRDESVPLSGIEALQFQAGGLSFIEGGAWSPPYAGVFYLVVDHYGRTEPLHYSVQLDRSDNEGFEYNESAPRVELGVPYAKAFDFLNDRDVYSFQAKEGARYILQSPEGRWGVTIKIGASDNLQSDQPLTPVWTAPADGIYYVSFQRFIPIISGYSFQLNEFPAGQPLPEFGQTTELPYGAPTSPALLGGTAAQFHFTAEPGQTFTLQAAGDDTANLKLAIHSAEETGRIQHRKVRMGASPAWTLTPVTAGAFYVFTDNPDSNYTLTLTPVDEVGNNPNVVADTTINGEFDVAWDHDVFSFTPEKGSAYRLLFESSVGPQLIAVYAPNGDLTHIPVGDSWTADQEGIYRLFVDSREPGPYTMRIETIGDRWPNELSGTGTALRVGETIQANIDFRGDVDYIPVMLQQGEAIAVSIDLGDSQRNVTPTLVDARDEPVAWGDIAYRVQQSGQYFVTVQDFAGDSDEPVAYSLTRTVVPADDRPDSPEQVETTTPLGSDLHGHLETSNDRDVFMVSVSEPGEYWMKLNMLDPVPDLKRVRWKVQRTESDSHSRSANDLRIRLEFPEAGEFPLEVWATKGAGRYVMETEFIVPPAANFAVFEGRAHRMKDLEITPQIGDQLVFDAMYTNPGALGIKNAEGVYQAVFVALPTTYIVRQTPLYINIATVDPWREIALTVNRTGNAYDTDDDGIITAVDIHQLDQEIADGKSLAKYDVNGDGNLNSQDRELYFSSLGLLQGDLNLDGRVDFADFLRLSRTYDQRATWEDGDVNGDGIVDFADFLILNTQFRQFQ